MTADLFSVWPEVRKTNLWFWLPLTEPEYSLGGLMLKLKEAPILWPPDVSSWLIGKDHDAGKDWGQEKEGVAEDEMVGWHHWLSGHESEQSPGDSKEQGSLVHCSPWGHKELDTTEWLNSNKWASFIPVPVGQDLSAVGRPQSLTFPYHAISSLSPEAGKLKYKTK